MKPAPFEYMPAPDLETALEVLGASDGEAKALAGGQSLVPMLNLRLARPSTVIDINGIGLDMIERHGDRLSLGALVRHRTLEGDGAVAERAPLLAAAARLIGHPPIRVRGTLGGSLAHADPAAELPTAAVALDAVMQLASAGGGRRRVPAVEFYVGPFMTTIRDEELLIGIDVPLHGEHGCAFEQVAIRAGDFAVVGVAATVRRDAEGRVEVVRIAVGGAGAVPVRASAAERLLLGERIDALALQRAGRAAREAVDPSGDVHGSRQYRLHLTDVLTRRALEAACRKEKSR
jgi:carbon-monoxide dehydrogenase medium subunit